MIVGLAIFALLIIAGAGLCLGCSADTRDQDYSMGALLDRDLKSHDERHDRE